MRAPEIRRDIRKHLRQWQARLLWQRSLYAAAAVSLLVLLARLEGTSLPVLALQALAVFAGMLLLLLAGGKWRRLTPDNFLRHLDRRFPAMEESAFLLVTDEDSLGELQALQRRRVLAVYRESLAQTDAWREPLRLRLPLSLTALCLVLSLFPGQIRDFADGFFSPAPQHPQAVGGAAGTTVVTGVHVRIQPPAYTGLPETQSAGMDIRAVEGSRVHWALTFDPPRGDFALQFSDGRRIEMAGDGQGRWLADAVVSGTGLYHVVERVSGSDVTVGDIHALEIGLDKAPQVRIVLPEAATLEIPVHGPARFSSEALVSDDYGVESVEILASVAKGSGEGVKFRDRTLAFDGFSETGGGQVHRREWDLRALGMEPGDEVYFTVLATDNREPASNTGRSETLIVRWLDDRQTALSAEGLAIDVLPEYFRSQRQIIIDTEQLLGEQQRLEVQEFRDTAYAIGRSQADLKQRYGQYLGDEFGEGPGEQLGIMQEIAGEAEDEHDGHDEQEGRRSEAAGTGINTTADILRLFGHDHGDPEVGPITRRNPVALMKRAVGEMWQAERHLMQAEPQLALPYEYEAYKYLKLARQADRIYVKRLGFEPPPVSEERRLSGELEDILSYRLTQDASPPEPGDDQWFQHLLRQLYQLLETHYSGYTFTDAELDLLSRLGAEMTARAQQRPALIRYAATLEKLVLRGRLELPGCENCIAELAAAAWNLMDEGQARFGYRTPAWHPQDELTRSYLEFLEERAGTPSARPPGVPDR